MSHPSRIYPVLQQLIHQPVVEFQPFRIRWSLARWKHPRPRNRESVPAHPQLLQQPNILPPEVVAVVGHVARVVVVYLARLVREGVPDRRPTPILPSSTLDLVGRCRASP